MGVLKEKRKNYFHFCHNLNRETGRSSLRSQVELFQRFVYESGYISDHRYKQAFATDKCLIKANIYALAVLNA